jgi:UDP-N-acetylglucosamine--N-acetylmuramyl-(pentapeptide) pyrophosphoryl-undecaprenol N-acetylglucosamine transferase
MTSIAIAAGGTGGHLMPAFAVADAIRSIEPGARISFVGTNRASEREMLARAGERSHATAVRPVTKDLRGLSAPFALARAVGQARAALRAEGTRVVLGMGGYPSVPAMIAARIARIPSILHEQNAVPGFANEIAARFTRNVAVSFPEAVAAFRSASPAARLTGLPLRPAIASFDRVALRAEAFAFFGLDPARPVVLVFGGSLGARRLNDAALECARRWDGKFQVLLVSGSANAEVAARAGDALRCVAFCERMELAYAAAEVAVCRAGASTVAELAATGTPSVLVPLPVARRKEQHANARVLANAGGALAIEDRDADAARIAPLVEDLLGDDARRASMAAAARTVARPDAAFDVARWVLELGAPDRAERA